MSKLPKALELEADGQKDVHTCNRDRMSLLQKHTIPYHTIKDKKQHNRFLRTIYHAVEHFVDLSLVTALILLGASFIAAIAVYPFLIELTDEEEPLW